MLDGDIFYMFGKRTKVVLLILVVVVLERCFFYSKESIQIKYIEHTFRLHNTEAQRISTNMFALSFLMSFVGGYMGDFIFQRHIVLILSIFFYLIGVALFLFSTLLEGMKASQIYNSSLWLIAFGSGLMRPNIITFTAFHITDEQLLQKFFSSFYITMNVGGIVSATITPAIYESIKDMRCFDGKLPGSFFIYLIPTVLSIIGFLLFIFCIKIFDKSVKPVSFLSTIKSIFTGERRKENINRILYTVLIFTARSGIIFLFQMGGNLQYLQKKMNSKIGSYTLATHQLQVLNPLIILILVPFMDKYVFKSILKSFTEIGFYILALSLNQLAYIYTFLLHLVINKYAESNQKIHYLYQIPAIIFLSLGEIFESLTTTEYAFSFSLSGTEGITSAMGCLSITLGCLIYNLVLRYTKHYQFITRLWINPLLGFIFWIFFLAVKFFMKRPEYIKKI